MAAATVMDGGGRQPTASHGYDGCVVASVAIAVARYGRKVTEVHMVHNPWTDDAGRRDLGQSQTWGATLARHVR